MLLIGARLGNVHEFFHGSVYLKLLLMAEILHQLIGSLSHYLQGFIHPRWCRISSINSRTLRTIKISQHHHRLICSIVLFCLFSRPRGGGNRSSSRSPFLGASIKQGRHVLKVPFDRCLFSNTYLESLRWNHPSSDYRICPSVRYLIDMLVSDCLYLFQYLPIGIF